MGKQEYVLMPRHGEACDRQQSQCSDYVLMTSNKQITVFEFLIFMRFNIRTISEAVNTRTFILMEILRSLVFACFLCGLMTFILIEGQESTNLNFIFN